MQLPESLHPWRQWLEWFAPEQLPLFADLLGRINPILGPFRGLQQGGVPEPDGLGDLQRRGTYERLLSSEWLLADEMPDEFLRRAAVGEHMFLAPQYHARQANRLIVVLFDAGPLQLGAARLVHLALLMLLARRALEVGAELCWGILQNAPVLYELESSAQLKQLLNARTYQVVDDEHWQTWRAWLSEQQHNAGECWLVGQRLPTTDGRSCTHRVQIHRNLDGRSLSFELQAADPRRVSLPIPDERLALQLLKGRFDGEVVVVPVKGNVPRVSLTLPPVISDAGTHVALKMLDDPGMVVIRLPTENQKKNLDVRRSLWSSGRAPLTITFVNRTVGAVLSDDRQLWFWNMPGLFPIDKPSREELQLPPGTATLLPAVWLRGSSTGRLFLLDNQGHLASWGARTTISSNRHNIGKAHPWADKVLGLAKVDKDVVAYVRNDGGRLYAHSIGADGNASSAHVIGVAEGVNQVLFAASQLWRRSFGGCALRSTDDGNESWRVISATSFPVQAEQITLARGWKALGLLLQKGDDHYSLVLRGPDKQTVALYCEGQQRVLFTTSHAISRVSFCPMSGLVAALTSARELLVYSVHLRSMRLQVFCTQAPENPKAGADV
ncbi:hypothetical protein [Phytopseudomonas dryadis]|uniref:Uncharacterized protein n=1 Tax=Phytopseudomonas dryadis TaxID=2487520 RepID=A0ABY1Z620_9GAMM|nr:MULTISPECIES: hypothetical protein [Pseudomonas]TBV02296.1 hypothetical protein DNK34_19170 [Pseudomonas dryadis]TBV15240.1 hypothetical protein DNK41_18055 [Pseudomonas sp. FRB 230]